MARFKYNIELSFLKDNTSTEIKAENIKSFFIYSDFENANMATMYAVLHLDKNFYDEIIKNAKTASMVLNVYRLTVDDNTETRSLTEYKGECYYFISGDINYNKELDYTEATKDRKDIYREVHIGLIYKECVENNKQTSNNVIINTTMINAVASYVPASPLLIENFTYNDVIGQLIVPPQPSLYKTINFLNSIKVFYSTPYRFFIEPGCIYLISSSGKAVQKKSEKYKTVMFKIHPITGEGADILGMSEDDTNKLYSIDVNVLDTNYNIDNDTSKTTSKISSIINPGKDNSLVSQGAIQNAMTDVNKIKDRVLGNIEKKIAAIKLIPRTLGNVRCNVASGVNSTLINSDEAVIKIDRAIAAIKALPEPEPVSDTGTPTGPVVPSMTGEEKVAVIDSLTKNKESILANRHKISSSSEDINSISGNVITSLSKTTNHIPGLFNSITPINIGDNINAIKKSSGAINSMNLDSINKTDSKLLPQITNGGNISSAVNSVFGKLSGLGIPDIAKIAIELQPNISGLHRSTGLISDSINTFKSLTGTVANIGTAVASSIKGLDGLNIDLKSQFTNNKLDIQSIVKKNNNISLSSLIGSSTNALNMLKSKGLSMSLLQNISKDINKVADISQIGKLGVSKFDVNLTFGEGSDTTANNGDKIIKIDNDNANKLKNIKAYMENKTNRLSVNKNDLDLSVFTINKEYIVKNYDAHSNKDGRFILSRKVEIFIREDEKFLLNTMLEFDKLADENKTTSSASELGKSKTPAESDTSKSTQYVISKAKNIIEKIKSNKTVNILKDAKKVNDEFKQLNSSKTSSRSLSSIIESTKVF